ncbi:type II toxin-antitoxin system ParD family antitoxin [Enterovirga sp.]|uniref:type II toxin-antitoxin system ParD family antitoxin n=1 Tax=Enterovirga sp. TaxID=2026350 RepID=UPI002B66C417|nr:type II toxin-antitoxin system ParD family antitoxin [Enterovirga sp.]HMO29792.1 type II toxin-antitoxin system ParD family antitoxin [Enterovirga sp.]
MDVSLTPELERRIAEKVASGLYESPSEVVREGLRLLFAAEVERSRRRDELDALIQVGLDQLDRGEGIDGEIVRARMMARFGSTG